MSWVGGATDVATRRSLESETSTGVAALATTEFGARKQSRGEGTLSEEGQQAVTERVRTSRPTALVRPHAVGIGVALILAAILVLPRWWMLTTPAPDGVRVPISLWGAGFQGSDEAREVSAIRQAYDGKLPLRAPYLANHRDAEMQAGAGWQEAIGILGHVTGGPFWALAIVTTVMGALAMLLLYALGLRLTGSRLIAVAVLPIAIAFAQVLIQGDGLFALRHHYFLHRVLTADPVNEFLYWSRFLWPIMVMAPFFAVVLALPRVVDTGDWRWGTVAAVSLALLVYSYVFFWTTMALAVGAWGVWLLYRRDFESFRRLAIVCGAATILALPELAITANKSIASTPDVDARVGLQAKAIVLRPYPQRILIGLPFFFGLWRGHIRHGALYACLFVAPVILSSIHGVIPQPWHYQSQVFSGFAIPAMVAGGAGLVSVLPSPSERVALAGLVGLAAVSTVYVLAFQARALHQLNPVYSVSHDEHDALRWVRANVKGDETVVSPSIVTNWNLADLTPASEYIMSGYNPVADDDELIDRFLRVSIAYGYTEDAIFDRLDPDHYWDWDDHGQDTSAMMRATDEAVVYYTFYDEWTHHEEMEERVPEWRERYERLKDRANVLAAYPAQYLYCGRRERTLPDENPAKGIYVRRAFHEGSVTIYKLVKQGAAGAVPFKGCTS